MSFKNKVILITGASSGIGAACAEYFAREGALLALVGRNADKFEKVTEKIKEAGVENEPLVILADVSVDTERIMAETIGKYKRLDVLINNAGFAKCGTIETTIMDDYDAVMATNIRAVFQLTQLAVPYLIESKGNIVNVSSVCTLRPFTGFLSYNLAKAALDQLTKCVALELAEKGVRVNSVNPAVIDTDFHYQLGVSAELYPVVLIEFAKMHPVGRVGQSLDVTDAIAFLANENASFITGICLPIDGGLAIKSPQTL